MIRKSTDMIVDAAVKMRKNTELKYLNGLDDFRLLAYDIDKEDLEGMTPLAHVLENCKFDSHLMIYYKRTIDGLLLWGADVKKLRAKLLFSLVDRAGKEHKSTIVAKLIESGAAFNISYDDNTSLFKESLLHKAIRYADFALAKVLLQRGCSANIKDLNGKTPLHYLFISEYIGTSEELDQIGFKFIDLLLEYGASFNQKDDYGVTPAMDLARENYILHIVKYRKFIDLTAGSTPMLRCMSDKAKEAWLQDEFSSEDIKIQQAVLQERKAMVMSSKFYTLSRQDSVSSTRTSVCDGRYTPLGDSPVYLDCLRDYAVRRSK